MIKNVYIHIPFCKYICSYCDFCKKYIKNQPIDEYLDALEWEISQTIDSKIEIETLYIGGGTPSALNPNQREKLAMIIAKYFSFTPNYEFTFECNPDDVDELLVQQLEAMKVNRVSIGVQTLNDDLLRELKREHCTDDVVKAVELLAAKIPNISCDFIFNLPNQEFSDLETSFAFIEKYQLKHVSYYGLILEENTILDCSDYQLKSVETELEWYQAIQSFFKKHDYHQYEISNFAKCTYESKHNLAYWQQKQYYGFGLGASAYINDERITNTKSLKDYLEQKNIQLEVNKITKDDFNYEKIFLNLRTDIGIELDFVNELSLKYDERYFEIHNERLRIKPEYYYESNEHIVELLMQLDEE